MGAPRIIISTDSQVAGGHIDKSYQARNPELTKYLATFKRAKTHFRGVTVASTPRTSKATAANTPLPPHVMYEVLSTPATWPSDTPPSIVAAIDTMSDWCTPIIDILTGQLEALTGTKERWLHQSARS
ncbi:hypothetical protein E2562_002120 [Oryza meyeriana var. granulata]|uniref:Uncharacterized protein n=1 Tax=Oryza meyeriana var. granulata TaxID=110450 RepID=A0A6G1EDW9_9ORYZ|nr:hypothetical protein E2562_002120 [Oryza meyeriana var. granulata]